MNDRRIQWLRFYEKALTGTAALPQSALQPIDPERHAEGLARRAEHVANAAMAQLDELNARETKVEALITAATELVSGAEGQGLTRVVFAENVAALGKALADLKAQD